MAIITVKIDADDKAVLQKIERVKRSLGELDNRPGDFVPSFDVSNLPGALRQISTLQGAMGSLGSLGIGGALAAAGMQVGQMAFELGKMGSETLRVKDAYADLATQAGISGQAMLQAMRQATAGTVTDSDLMLAANRAMMLGVSDNAQELSGLMAAAIERGRSLGMSAQQAVSDIITGIGRMSPAILDNLGIANAAGAFDVYAQSLGTTADKLTDVQKKQALVNAVLASATPGGQVAEDAAAAFERMDTALANAKDALGELFSPAVAAIAQGLADAVNVMNDAWRDTPTSIADVNKQINQLRQQIRDINAQEGEPSLWSVNRTNALQAQIALLQEQKRLLTETGQTEQAAPVIKLPRVDTSELEQQIADIRLDMTEAVSMRDAFASPERAGGPDMEMASQMDAEVTRMETRLLDLQAAVAGANAQVQAGGYGYAAMEREMARLGTTTESTSAALAGSALLQAEVASRLKELSAQSGAAAESLTRMYIAAAADLGVDQGLAGLQAKRAELDQLRLTWQYMYTTEEGFQAAEAAFLARTNQELADQRAAIDEVANAAANAANLIGQMRSSVTKFKTAALASIEGSLGGIAVGLMDNMDADAALAWLDQQSAAYATQIDQLSAMRNADGSLKYTNQEILLLLQGQVAETGKWATGLDQVASSTAKIRSDYDAMKEKLSGIVGGEVTASLSLSPIGVDPADFLPRPDAVQEDAFRLADVMVNGFASPWATYFESTFPALFSEMTQNGDIQAGAAAILQQFQQGMRPELLNFDAIKEKVKAALAMDDAIAGIRDQITAELMGAGASAEQVQGALSSVLGGLGLSTAGAEAPDLSSTGGSAAASFNDGFTAAANGGALMVKISAQMVAQISLFDNAGRQAGTKWGAGFTAVVEQGVGPYLLEMLVTLVTPGVMAKLAAAGTAEGAQ